MLPTYQGYLIFISYLKCAGDLLSGGCTVFDLRSKSSLGTYGEAWSEQNTVTSPKYYEATAVNGTI